MRQSCAALGKRARLRADDSLSLPKCENPSSGLRSEDVYLLQAVRAHDEACPCSSSVSPADAAEQTHASKSSNIFPEQPRPAVSSLIPSGRGLGFERRTDFHKKSGELSAEPA
jgi:hypothetical protein